MMLIAKMEFTFYSEITRITAKMRFNFEADDVFTKEGDWEPADAASKELSRIYFDDVGGYWEMNRVRNDRGDTREAITMREHKPLSGIEFIWKSVPRYVATLYFVPVLPFQVGSVGPGDQSAPPYNKFQWTVIGT